MNNILVIPSIDIKNGKTVRVVQGIPELNSVEYGNDPIEMALIWRAENAKAIHVVDFDASANISKENLKFIQQICEAVIIPVEFGGGLSTYDEIKKTLDAGIYRVVIGSMAYDNPKEFQKALDHFTPTKIVAAIDVINDEVVVHGRKIHTGIKPLDFAIRLKEMGVTRFTVTDVMRNGMLTGPNVELSKKIAMTTGCKVTHSGGISGYNDLKSLKDAAGTLIDSVIIGRALYENRFPCQKIWRVAESGLFS
ncbi:1-(5-phosphoribosyl)-5-((5-phosphoribosylamino)methylideneamino)imidazole-4-carboxamide isomerase [bacterium BRH_c32]|nr:MAG: 1-(5-phosphoribosyl)-5-((5-phosphoribosylamino)methylideneamino)imidazole-4-carboxamide isomerase [bacterium BRH_c32]